MKNLAMLAAIAAGISAGALFYHAAETKGVVKERARVEAQGKKIDAKAQKVRAAVAAKPASSLLESEYRD